MTEPAKQDPAPDRKRTLSNQDGDVLERYFCQHKSAFSRSITGPMLTKAELYSSGTYPCYWCEGDFPGIKPNGEWCEKCNGTGFCSLFLKSKEEITAQPTAEITASKGYEPDHGMLQEYGQVARRLDVVKARAGMRALTALEEYHGDSGAKWGRTRWGRMFCIYPLTASGRRLLVQVAGERNNEVVLTPLERLGVQAELQRVKPDEKRRELLAKALTESEAIYQLAVDAWIDSAPPRPAKPKDTRPRKAPEKWSAVEKPAREFYGEDGRLRLREVVGRE